MGEGAKTRVAIVSQKEKKLGLLVGRDDGVEWLADLFEGSGMKITFGGHVDGKADTVYLYIDVGDEKEPTAVWTFLTEHDEIDVI